MILIRIIKENIKKEFSMSITIITSDTSKQQMVSMQIFLNRRGEILEYLKLFGYKNEKTILNQI